MSRCCLYNCHHVPQTSPSGRYKEWLRKNGEHFISRLLSLVFDEALTLAVTALKLLINLSNIEDKCHSSSMKSLVCAQLLERDPKMITRLLTSFVLNGPSAKPTCAMTAPNLRVHSLCLICNIIECCPQTMREISLEHCHDIAALFRSSISAKHDHTISLSQLLAILLSAIASNGPDMQRRKMASMLGPGMDT